MCYIYILKSNNYKKSYVGHTSDLDRRLKEHNEGKSEYTNRYKPWKLIHKEEYNSLEAVIKKEKYYKSHAGREKLKIIFKHCGIV